MAEKTATAGRGVKYKSFRKAWERWTDSSKLMLDLDRAYINTGLAFATKITRGQLPMQSL